MKKKYLTTDSVINRLLEFLLCLVALLGWVQLDQSPTQASTELDRQYQLENIGFLKPDDNVDGLFAEYFLSTYKDYFTRYGRFLVNDLAQADSILSKSKIPYSKVIRDPELLNQLMRATRTESLLRTTAIKEGPRYSVTIDWLHAPGMEVVNSVQFYIDEPKPGTPLGDDLISKPVIKNLDLLMSQLPFIGTISGRDQNSVTVNIGNHSSIHKDDILVVGTLEEVKKHPLFKRIVDWGISPTGKMQVEQIEDGMAFCRILEESHGRQILRNQKIIKIMSAPTSITEKVSDDDQKEALSENFTPKIGWLGLNLGGASYNRQFNSRPFDVSNTGGGIGFLTRAEAEIWLTRNWFSQIQLGYGSWGFSQKDVTSQADSPATQGGGISGSVFTFRLGGGYTHLFTDQLLGPRGWIKFGYKSNAYSLPASATENTGTTSFLTLYVGLGGDMPLRGNWGALVDFDFRVFTIVRQTWMSGGTSGSSDVQLFFGGYYRTNPRMMIRGGFELVANGVDFVGNSSLSQKTITIGPSLLYYF